MPKLNEPICVSLSAWKWMHAHTRTQTDRSMYAPHIRLCECWVSDKNKQPQRTRWHNKTNRNFWRKKMFEPNSISMCLWLNGSLSLSRSWCVCEYVFKAPFNLLLKRLLNFPIVCSSVLALYLNASCDMDLNSGFSTWTWLCHTYLLNSNKVISFLAFICVCGIFDELFSSWCFILRLFVV